MLFGELLSREKVFPAIKHKEENQLCIWSPNDDFVSAWQYMVCP